MSIFSVSGLSSGIDFANLTSKMIEFERRPINLLEAKQTEYKKQQETWNEIKGKISQFETTVSSMKSVSDLSTIKGSFPIVIRRIPGRSFPSFPRESPPSKVMKSR